MCKTEKPYAERWHANYYAKNDNNNKRKNKDVFKKDIVVSPHYLFAHTRYWSIYKRCVYGNKFEQFQCFISITQKQNKT